MSIGSHYDPYGTSAKLVSNPVTTVICDCTQSHVLCNMSQTLASKAANEVMGDAFPVTFYTFT